MATDRRQENTLIDLGAIDPERVGASIIWPVSGNTPGTYEVSYEEKLVLKEVIPGKQGKAARPGSSIVERFAGWSVAGCLADHPGAFGRFTFGIAPDTVGAIVGLSTSPPRVGSIGRLLAGVYVSAGVARVLANGALVTAQGFEVHQYTAFYIRFNLVTGELWVGADGQGEYRITVGSAEVSAAYLHAMLYMGGDSVWAAGVAPVSMQPDGLIDMQALGGKYGTHAGVLSPVEARGSAPLASYAELSPLQAWGMMNSLGAAGVARGFGVMGAVEAVAVLSPYTENPKPEGYGLQVDGYLDFLPSARLVQGANMSGEALLGAMDAFGINKAGYGVQRYGDMGQMQSYGDGLYSVGRRRTMSMGSLTSRATLSSEVLLKGASIVQLLGYAGIESLSPLLGASVARFRTSAQISSDDDADLSEIWVVNLGSNASTRYANYVFDGMAQIGSKHYGLKDDGLYLLEGGTDAGAPIPIGLATGQLDFADKHIKHVPYLYMDVQSPSMVRVNVTLADGKRFGYHARSVGRYNRNQRVDMGRGLRSPYFAYELRTMAPGFELDGLEFDVHSSQRRI